MKCALVISALAALVAAADKPKFLNSNFQVIEGKQFTLEYDGCVGGCTIVLQNGPQNNLKDVKTITTSATGGSFTWTPEHLASGTYAIKIINNANKEFNYSQQFSYLGTGATVTASGASTTGSATGSSTGSATASTEASSTVSITASRTESSTASSTASTTISTVTSSATSTSGSSTTSAPSSTTSQSSTSIRSTTSATTTVPNAGVRATPMAFVAGAVAALAYFG
ncbi:extracellular matrix protein precursor [Metarhizium acridum CQMa 102]|uniref:Extracellular matrix protein n=1 Tax=Metarhizium acridum (strain CQMa 102) TaxID=655827 RepID=E9DZE5_METAQ|nr:extracellular matrix protein precursor [Metarhizium acridum CQMa 102]EFY90877.1 extracellular matrix protein precursor [Metarhizium acridum CQMa 102]